MHWQRWRKTGDPRLTLGDLRSPICSIDGCSGARVARGWCGKHVARFYAHGDPTLGASRKGRGYIKKDGYVLIGKKGHPLAKGERQNVTLHRVVLYDAIGPGPHGCHWCGVLIAWFPTEMVERLVVDHVDGDRLNNDRSNLVPSCHTCNTSRARFGSVRAAGVLA